LPASLTDLNLVGVTRKGIEIDGETNIDKRKERTDFNPSDEIVRIYFGTHADSNPRVLEAISAADKIVFAPGDLFTSILPHLLVEGVSEAIRKSHAKVYFVLNLTTKAGETDYFKASDYVKAFLFYLGDNKRLNYLIANNQSFEKEIVSLYKEAGQEILQIDEDACKKLSPKVKIIKANLGEYLKKDHLLRHNSKSLAQTILRNG